MLNRRFVREKTIQALYSFYQGGIDAAASEKYLLNSLDHTYQLYVFHFSLLVALRSYFKKREELTLQKFILNEEEKNLHAPFLKNRALLLIEENPVFILKNADLGFAWDQQTALLHELYLQIISSKVYEEYKAVESPDFETDREFLYKIYKKKIASNAHLISICEEKSIFWAGDYESVSFWVTTVLKEMPENGLNFINPGYLSSTEKKENAEVQFALKLMHSCLLHSEEYDRYIFERLENWDSERVALIELIIMRAAITEFINFPSIPVNVTLNEYIEISKRYCSEKSRIFVNGLLNKIVSDLRDNQTIRKSGRGLI